MKRYTIVLVVMLLFSTFFSGFALANEDGVEQPHKLVALGDSITYGSGLGNPSSEAFPYLIGNAASLDVTNLGKPGWTSGQLLTAVKSDVSFMEAIAAADVITLNIGGNDLFQAVGVQEALATGKFESTPELEEKVRAAGLQLGKNLGEIIGAIRAQAPTAPIVLYNIYNPFGPSEVPSLQTLYEYGEQVNSMVIGPIQTATGSILANAYSAFSGNQASYIIPGDVHPNVAGHQALASLVNNILFDLLPEEDPGTENPDPDETGRAGW
ncbi:SGNH/GDSL hydrolase family protein [Mesobacillus maritimus]|uniref:SGNH/GDSL hydrolase family protein n=1 Tax=Mesobacillus maritimus TaxID=1643336 RepID=UPI00384C7B66